MKSFQFPCVACQVEGPGLRRVLHVWGHHAALERDIAAYIDSITSLMTRLCFLVNKPYVSRSSWWWWLYPLAASLRRAGKKMLFFMILKQISLMHWMIFGFIPHFLWVRFSTIYSTSENSRFISARQTLPINLTTLTLNTPYTHTHTHTHTRPLLYDLIGHNRNSTHS